MNINTLITPYTLDTDKYDLALDILNGNKPDLLWFSEAFLAFDIATKLYESEPSNYDSIIDYWSLVGTALDNLLEDPMIITDHTVYFGSDWREDPNELSSEFNSAVDFLERIQELETITTDDIIRPYKRSNNLNFKNLLKII